MSPRQKARLAFVSALTLLLVCGVAASVTVVRFLRADRWVTHSYDVQLSLGDLQSAISVAARARTSFLNSGDVSNLGPYDAAKSKVHQQLIHIRDLTKDNPIQQSLCTQLEDNVLRRLELLDTSIEMRKSAPLDDATQLRLSRENVNAADGLLTQSVTETRTISHLLHPPLLDEVGLASAARWYVEGFAKRSGIELTADISDEPGRLPRPAELVLFRVLQESLTNIHRHSKSLRAEVSLHSSPANVILLVRDYGKGMPRETLANFLIAGTNVGVGLAGMRERVREQGGRFDIRSDKTGTTITVTMPVVDPKDAASELASAPSTD